MLAQKILDFNSTLKKAPKVPKGIEVLNPFLSEDALLATKLFYEKFYNDDEERTFIFGINPGRFGAGITGIPFTDPVVLENECGIKNEFHKRKELSSEFVYMFINAFGGPQSFYSQFFITGISPLGYLKDGKNINYYDDRQLQAMLTPYITRTIEQQFELNCNRNIAFCLGEGKNYKCFNKLNEEKKYFAKIIPLPHPRYVMQYKRKYLNDYINKIVNALNQNQ